MGIEQSTSRATPRSADERPRGIWPKYTWTDEEFAWCIQNHLVSPCLQPIADVKRIDLAYCEICYHGFPVINECSCCNHTLCTECLAAVVPKEQYSQRHCPVCKTSGFGVKPNVDKPHLKNKPFDPEPVDPEKEAIDWDDSLPEGINLAIVSYPNVPKEVKDDLIMMYRSGVLSVDEVVANFIAIASE